MQRPRPWGKGSSVKFIKEPWEHQLKAINRASTLNSYGLFFDVGTGKTGTAINILREKYTKHKKLFPTMILCPPIVIENWKREFLIHSNINENEIIPLVGTGKKRLETFKATGKNIYITNYETLLMRPVFEAFRTWLEWAEISALVVDESHKIKDMKAKRTKLTIELADRSDYRYLLSGTPVLNSLMDIFTQMRVLDRGESFGKNFWTFRMQYFYDANKGMPKNKYFPDWRTRKGALEKISHKIGARSMSVKKQECLDLPPLVKQTIPVEMSKEQTKLYKEMKANFIAIINDQKAAVAKLAITKALRLQQLVSGFVSVEEGAGQRSNFKIKDNPRAKALKDLLEDLTPHHKVIVWAVFKENYNAIREVCESLKLEYVEVHGGVTPVTKNSNVDIFNTDERCRVLIGHPGSGGIGINLVSASYSIFYSRSFSLEYDIQAEARNYRGGSEIHPKITRIDLVTPGTIDELVLKSLASKQEISEKVLRENLEEL